MARALLARHSGRDDIHAMELEARMEAARLEFTARANNDRLWQPD
jgi:hypothetical protein